MKYCFITKNHSTGDMFINGPFDTKEQAHSAALVMARSDHAESDLTEEDGYAIEEWEDGCSLSINGEIDLEYKVHELIPPQ
jgi:hypothetical protein